MISTSERNLSGWFLAGTDLDPHDQHRFSSLMVHRHSGSGEAEEIRLPVFLNGRIREVIKLPDDVARLSWQPPKSAESRQARLSIRRVGWLERNLRMAIRVLRTYSRLSERQGTEPGLSLWRAFLDLPNAYRIATRIRFRMRSPVLDYAGWIERFDTLQEQDTVKIKAHITRFAEHPHFQLLVVVDDFRPEVVQATLKSLRGQLYRNFTCTVLDNAGALDASFNPDTHMKDVGLGTRVVPQDATAAWLAEFNASLAGGRRGKWIMVVRAGAVLPSHSLYWFACEIQAHPDSAILYSDDDTLDANGRRSNPRFKPDWSPSYLYSTHYMGSAAILRGSDVAAAGGLSLDCCRHGNYDLLLRVLDSAGGKITHVPAVLVYRATKTPGGIAWEDPQWCAGALQMHLARKGVVAEVAQTQQACWRVHHRLPVTPPLVSIIVPTRNHMALLRECVESVRGRTTYPRFEILVFDNHSTEPETLDYLNKVAGYPSARVLRYDQPFNYSMINNIAAREARGEVLCLLNNDTWIISPDWLEEMVGHLLQERVGAVGAKLFYPDGRVQHAGVAVGPGGCADHLYSGLAHGEPGYCNRAVVAQEVSAVTGACLVTWKPLYERLGGLNESDLTVTFNDVDYCLRLQEAGYRVIFTPHAELYHHESATRGKDDSSQKRKRAERELRYMRSRWKQRMEHDPYYNPNLSYQRPDFSLSEAPRVRKPWL